MAKIHALSALCFALLVAPSARADGVTRPWPSPAPPAATDGRLIAGLAGAGVGAVSMGIAIVSVVEVHSAQQELDPSRRGRPEAVDVCDDTKPLTGVDVPARHKILDLCTRGQTAVALEEIFLPVSLLSIAASVF